jgi:uncharacterized protein (DUF305 family)
MGKSGQKREDLKMKRNVSLAAVVAGSLWLGCSDGTGSDSRGGAIVIGDGGIDVGDGGVGDALHAKESYGSPVPYTPGGDVAFIDAMVPHHLMAIAMANMVIERGMRMDVKQFALRIKESQTGEVAQMRALRTAITGSGDVPTAPRDPHAEQTMMVMMTQTGASLEQLFLDDMLAHHAGGVQLAHRALPNLETTDMRGLAENIFEVQSTEIGEIQTLRAKR